MSKKILIFLTLAMLVLTIATVGCKVNEGVISFADSAAEECLIALNNKDYDSYRNNMDDAMLEAVPEQEFVKFYSYLENAIGQYVPGSKNYSQSIVQSGINVVIYEADYTKETEKVKVSIAVSEPEEGKYQISGTWFDSPKLRETEYK